LAFFPPFCMLSMGRAPFCPGGVVHSMISPLLSLGSSPSLRPRAEPSSQKTGGFPPPKLPSPKARRFVAPTRKFFFLSFFVLNNLVRPLPGEISPIPFTRLVRIGLRLFTRTFFSPLLTFLLPPDTKRPTLARMSPSFFPGGIER